MVDLNLIIKTTGVVTAISLVLAVLLGNKKNFTEDFDQWKREYIRTKKVPDGETTRDMTVADITEKNISEDLSYWMSLKRILYVQNQHLIVTLLLQIVIGGVAVASVTEFLKDIKIIN